MFDLPIRVDVATGERLPAPETDPYSLPWVQGAAATVPLSIRRKYAHRIADLRDSLRALKSRGTKDDDAPAYGPRLRPADFRAIDQTPRVNPREEQ